MQFAISEDFSQPLSQTFSESLLKASCLLTGLGCSKSVPETFFRFYRSLKNYTDVYKNNCSALTSEPDFDLNKNTTFYIHGWTESQSKPSVRTIVSAYTAVKEENIVVFDWSIYSINSYPAAASKVKDAATESLGMIECFIAAGLRADFIKLVGFSLGGQIVGAIGNSFKERTNRTIRHITGLDPALEMFYPFANNLMKDSGDFVFVIHTTSGLAGYPPPMGKVDFLPNYGTVPQRPCPKKPAMAVFESNITTWDTAVNMSQLAILCDHHCSWMFFAESILRKDAYKAVCVDLNRENCIKDYDTAIMGYATPVSTRGAYYIDAACPDTRYIYTPTSN